MIPRGGEGRERRLTFRKPFLSSLISTLLKPPKMGIIGVKASPSCVCMLRNLKCDAIISTYYGSNKQNFREKKKLRTAQDFSNKENFHILIFF
jgi:hypothetical protein